MRSRCTVALVLLLALGLAAPAHAAPRLLYLIGGGPAKLGGADDLRPTIATGLDEVIGGTWTVKTKNRGGADGGVGLAGSLTRLLDYSVEAHFATRGGKWVATEPDSGELTQTLALNYFEFPLLAHVTFRRGATIQPSLLAGPVLGFRASSKLHIDDGSGSVPADLGKQAKSTLLSLAMGAGVDFRTSQATTLLVQWRYVTALGNAMKSAADLDLKPRGWTLFLGGEFRL